MSSKLSSVSRLTRSAEHTSGPAPSSSSPPARQTRSPELEPGNDTGNDIEAEIPAIRYERKRTESFKRGARVAAHPIHGSIDSVIIDEAPNELSPHVSPSQFTNEDTGAGYAVIKDGETTPESQWKLPPNESNGSGIADLIRALGNEISTVLDTHEIGLNPPKPYFPDSACLTLLNVGRIKSVLPEGPPELIDFIDKKAKKIFAITVLSNPAELHSAMDAFFRHNVIDADGLPIERKLTNPGECSSLDEQSVCAEQCIGEKPGRCQHDTRLNVFHHRIWDRTRIGTFYIQQWSFFLHQFHHDLFTYELHSHCILPFIKTVEQSSTISPGHFSRVTQAEMLAGFQDTISLVSMVSSPILLNSKLIY